MADFLEGAVGKERADKLKGKPPRPVELGGTTAGPLVNPSAGLPPVVTATGPTTGPKAGMTPKKGPPKSTLPGSGLRPPTGKDMTSQGVGEQAFDVYGGGFFEPGQQQEFWDDNAQAFETPGVSETIGGDVAADLAAGSQGDTYGQDYWQGVAGSGNAKDPGMIDAAWKNMQGVDANLDKYYDMAFQDSERQINRASASRGRFNSSESMRNVGDASARLNAQQAKDEATYKLDRARAMGDLAVSGTAGKAGWLTNMGELAFGAADEKREYGEAAATVANMAQNSEQNRLANGFAAALGIDADQLNSLMGGMNAAAQAQDLREGRVTGQQDYTLKIAEALARLYGDATGEDAKAGQDAIQSILAAATDQQRTKDAEADRRAQQINDAVVTGTAVAGNFSGGKTGAAAPVANTTDIVDPWAPGTGARNQP